MGQPNHDVPEPRDLRSFLRAFRVHPVGCTLSVVAYMLAIAITVYAIVSWARGAGLTSDWWVVLCGALYLGPPVWMNYAWRKGVFSRQRSEQLKFWAATRTFLLWCGLIWTIVALVGLAVMAIVSWAFWMVPEDPLPAISVCGFLAGGLAMLWGWTVTRKRLRFFEGKCVQCSYDLRGLTEPRCPECGTRFNPADLEEDRAGRASAPADRPGG